MVFWAHAVEEVWVWFKASGWGSRLQQPGSGALYCVEFYKSLSALSLRALCGFLCRMFNKVARRLGFRERYG